MTKPHKMDGVAERIFMAAISERRCGELLEALFEGGSATFDPEGRLVVFTPKQMNSVVAHEVQYDPPGGPMFPVVRPTQEEA